MGCIILIGVLLTLYYSPKFIPVVSVTKGGPYNLSSPTTVIKQTDASGILNPGGMGFQAFVYLNPLMRTGAHVDCGTGQGKPSCADGVFQPCKCDPTNGCGACGHPAYVSVFNLMGLIGLEIMPVPDASRQGQVKAQLTIKTETTGATAPIPDYYIETIPLPFINFQKWVMITVAREGRRFDIYFDDKLVVSQKTLNMPVFTQIGTNLNGVVLGSKNLVGQVANITLYTSRRTIEQVESDYTTLADTRGRPYLYNGSTIPINISSGSISGITPTFGTSMFPSLPDWSSFSFNGCFKGKCFNAPAVKPANGLLQWTSNYA